MGFNYRKDSFNSLPIIINGHAACKYKVSYKPWFNIYGFGVHRYIDAL